MHHIHSADHVITMASPLLLQDAAVVVADQGDIAWVGDRAEALRRYPQAQETRHRRHLLMPGLVNAHCHSGLLRGTAEGLPVWQWLQTYIDPMHRVLRAEEAECASWLCYAEALLSGTTTLVDMWRYMDGSARAAQALGLRVVLAPYVAEHPEHDYFETLDRNEALIDAWHGGADGRIQVWVGLEHLFYAEPWAWKRAVELTHRYRTGLHTHSNESRFDVAETRQRFALRPIEALEHAGLLDAHRVLLAHGVWLNDREIEMLAQRGIGVVHNPASNMKLASGIAPVQRLLAAGVAVGLGTDGEKENNNLDLFEEMKLASLLAKLRHLDASALDAWQVLGMATRDGARALGLEDRIGTLEAGKRADMIAVRTDTPRMTPLIGGAAGNLHHNLVHAVRGGDVSMTMVDGQVLVADGVLQRAELSALIDHANRLTPALLARRDDDVRRRGVPINEVAAGPVLPSIWDAD